uniref:Uncharacterized protein n=1 Tax=Poecilia latipinna TaxID=48699 RepID=A0A3B3VLR2_9TELE
MFTRFIYQLGMVSCSICPAERPSHQRTDQKPQSTQPAGCMEVEKVFFFFPHSC